jgi:hypothetical protein
MMGGVGGWRDKKEGVGLWMGDLRGEKGEMWERRNCGKHLWVFTSELVLLGFWARGGRKSDFLELGSRRGSVPSWLGGNSFRQ